MHIPPPVFFLAALLSQRFLARGRARGSGPEDAATVPSGTAPVRKVVSVGITGLSAAAMFGTAAQFSLRDTTVDPAHPDRASALITTGPNRLSRNPIYLGFAGLLVARALWLGSGRAMLPVAGFMAAMTPQIESEEAALLTAFGGEYARYLRRVPRWIGRRRLSGSATRR